VIFGDGVLAGVGLPVDVLHVHLEVVVAGELLVAEEALRHRPVGVVREFVPAQHLLEAEGQVAHLRGDKSGSAQEFSWTSALLKTREVNYSDPWTPPPA